MGGGAPPPPPGPTPGDGGPGGPDIAGAVQQAVTQAMSQQQMMQGAGGAGGMKPPKPDINMVATDVFQLKKMFLHFLRVQGIEMPPDILDGPGRDPASGMPSASPTGGSDAQPGSAMGGGGAGPQSAIKPIQPMQGAFPSPGGGGAPGGGGMGKTSAALDDFVSPVGQPSTFSRMRSKVSAVAQLCRQRN